MKNEERETRQIVSFFAAILLIFSTALTLKFTNSYFTLSKLYKKGIQAQGTIVERIREPGGRSHTYYYIRYKFENKYASETCVQDSETKTTPKTKACKITYRKQSITEKEYKELSAPRKVTVIYLPSETKTRSIVTGLSFGKNKLRVNIFLSLAAMLLIAFFLVKQLIRSLSYNLN